MRVEINGDQCDIGELRPGERVDIGEAGSDKVASIISSDRRASDGNLAHTSR